MAYGDATSKQAKTGYGWQFWMEYLKEGEVSASDFSDAKFVKVEGMKSGALPSPDRPEIDCTTTMDKVKAYLPGIGSINDISLEFNFYPENAVHQDIMVNVLYNDEPRWWKLTHISGMEFAFLGYLKSANTSFGVDQVLGMPLVLKVTSDPIVKFPQTAPPVLPEEPDESEEGAGQRAFGRVA